ncbi:MAG: tetratricopeptide repeat-containing sulfotransferase family protein [Alphaproteobacteria bacterium]
MISNAAKLADQLGETPTAIRCYKALLLREDLSPDDVFNIAYALKTHGDYESAVEAYKKSLNAGVTSPEEVYLNLGVIYADFLFDIEAAKSAFTKAIEHKGDFIAAHTNLGNLYEETADFDGAKRVYEKALESAPLAYEALARLANTYDFEDSDHQILKQIEEAAAHSSTSNFDKECLYFALGTARDSLKEYDKAFDAYSRANKHGLAYGLPYDSAAIKARTNALIDLYSAETYTTLGDSKRPPLAPPSPVFICGMFRSGSTLAEQVLGAHTDITPKGELDFFDRLQVKNTLFQTDKAGQTERDKIRTNYNRHAATHLIETPLFTDKRPDNLIQLGLIKTLFPHAKIIYTIRESLDNYLSIYFTQFSDGQNYARKLEDIAHYHREQQRLIAHWQSIFGEDIFTLSYDRFIADPVAVTNEMLSFLGLPEDENCLEFHKQRNRVKTASYKQVRRPLYKTSSGRAKNYAKYLTLEH